MKKTIPIFYASDANYLPYLEVSLNSLKQNANKKHLYKIYILNAGIDNNLQEPILSYKEDWFDIIFVNVIDKINEVKNNLQLRDYYTGATYYRIFIADLFPQYDKAIYLDSDTVVLQDISKLYKYNLKNNFVGAITDKVVSSNDIFIDYCEQALGINASNYFNAGILLMNLKKFREDNFYDLFKSLLLTYKFKVAQDQDYLNVICKDQVKYIPYKWNTMPIGGKSKKLPCLIHYNLTLKPWHYGDIPYAEIFWKYAKSTHNYDFIRNEFGSYISEKQLVDQKAEEHLINLAIQETNDKNNYYNKYVINQTESETVLNTAKVKH